MLRSEIRMRAFRPSSLGQPDLFGLSLEETEAKEALMVHYAARARAGQPLFETQEPPKPVDHR